jgi:hypothetical protein
MYRLVVGELYGPAWPDIEGADYNYRGEQHELRLFLAGVKAREITAVRDGPIDFGLLVEPEGLFLITRFGDTMSFESSYHWFRLDPTERIEPPATEETRPELRALITIILVELTTGIVLALRAVTFSPEFTRAIHRAIRDQIDRPYNAATYERWTRVMMRYETHMLWNRCTVRCRGGE